MTGTALNAYGIPLAARVVHVMGTGAAASIDATTAVDGTFTAANVVPPYDVTVVSGGINYVFLGLSSATPTIGMINNFDNSAANPTGADITVLSANNNLMYLAVETALSSRSASTDAFTSDSDTVTETGLAASAASGSLNATVSAIEYSISAGDMPTSYSSFIQEPETLLNGTGNAFTVDFGAGTPLTTVVIDVQASAFGGGPVANLNMLWMPSSHMQMTLYSDVEPDSTDATLTAPASDTTQIPMVLEVAELFSFVYRTVTSTTTQITVAMPQPPQVTSPPDATLTVDDTTTFSTNTDAVPATYVGLLLNDSSMAP